MTDSTTAAPERLVFEAEVSRLLQLMVHSVYSNKDIFLRELIANAADACERLRYLAIAEPELMGGDAALKIAVEADEATGTLAVVDNGIGMSRDDLKDNLGTIARSGTKAFVESLKEAQDGGALIGQFGVGFYSAFMVAKEVVVTTRRAGSDEAWTWTSDGTGSYTIAPADPATAPARGTRVLLRLADDAKEYGSPGTIERIVTTYSAHVPVPIVLRKAGENAEKTLADGSALWLKPKSAVTEDEYREFYGTLGGLYDKPAVTLHYRAEGRHEYSVLVFVPGTPPFDMFDSDRQARVKLYVRRVFITDEAKLLPGWLRFVRGVVDSADLPLNISREMLQANPILDAIRKGVTSRIVGELVKRAENDPEGFEAIWTNFGAVLKEGLYEAAERRDDLFKIARFRTTTGGERWRSLADYVKDLRPNQTAIFYALADSVEAAAASPQLEGFRARGIEVLLLADPVDAFWVRTALGYDGKPFQSVTQGSADLETVAQVEDAPAPAADGPRDADIAVLAARFKTVLGEAVADVRASQRLAESPVCLVASDRGPDRQMERLLARHEGAKPTAAPVLELNPRHALIRSLAQKAATGDPGLDDAAWLLYGQARILDGDPVPEPKKFAERLSRLMAGALG